MTISAGPSDDSTVRAPRGMLNKTMIDPVPLGEAEGTKQNLLQTMADPTQLERANELRQQLLQSPPTPMAMPGKKTLIVGGESAPEPEPPPPMTAPVPTPQMLGAPAMPASIPTPLMPEPSPLSRSVFAPTGLGSSPPPQEPPPPPQPTGAAKTMLGIPSTQMVPPEVRAQLGSSPAAAPVPTHKPTQAFGASPPAAPAPAPAPSHPHLAPAQKTMLGVAIPGIAPTQQAAPPPQQRPQQTPPLNPNAPLPHAQQFESRQGTMMGVAVPGIAPMQASPPAARMMTAVIPAAAPPPILPAPAPLVEEALPEAPRIVKKSGGISLGVVIAVIAVMLLGAGAVGAYLLLAKSPSPITAHPQLDESGKEFLALSCPSCPDGTNVSFGASTAQVKGGAATLALPAPLAIGDNDLQIKIDRPGSGRDEDVHLPLHVSYRVRADLSTLTAKPPAITVRVEVQPDSVVQVDGKPLTVDAQGKGAYVIDLSKESEGPSDEQKPFERKIPVVVTSKSGKAETDQLTARTSIVPLHVDAPGALLYTDKPQASIAGQTRVNGTITIDGKPTPVDDKGHFVVKVPLDAGEKKIEIVAGAAPLAPRTVHATVVHVAALDAKAKELQAENPLGYDAFSADTANKIGQKAFVEGDIVEARSGQGYSSLLVEEKKTCPKGTQCLVRVLLGEESTLAHGDTVRVFGKIAGVAAGKQPIPDLDASLVLGLKVGRH